MKLNIKEMREEVTGLLKSAIEVCNKNSITYYCQAGTVLGAIRHKGPIPWDHDADIIVPNNEIDRFVECCMRDLPKAYWVDFHTVNPSGYRLFPRIGKRGYPTRSLHLDIFRLIGLPEEKSIQMDMIREGVRYEKNSKYCERNRYEKLRWILSPIKSMDGHELKERIRLVLQHDSSFVDKMEELCGRYPYETARYVMNPCGKYGAKNIFGKEVYGEGQMVPYLDFEVRVPSKLDFYLKQYYGDYMKTPPKEEIEREMNRIFFVREIRE